MTSSEKTNWFVPLSVIAISVALLGLLYFQSADVSSQQAPQDRYEFDYAGRSVQPITISNQIVLIKNEILIDLYLLDMDPEQPYRKRFPKKEARKKLVIGKAAYRLVGVKDNNLTLKVLDEP